MSLPGRFKKLLSYSSGSLSGHTNEPLQEVAGVSELDRRLRAWSRHWASDSDAFFSEDQHLVNERLQAALKHFFGRRILHRLSTRNHKTLMPLAAPLFTAFLGRRAARELSRRVLTDL